MTKTYREVLACWIGVQIMLDPLRKPAPKPGECWGRNFYVNLAVFHEIFTILCLFWEYFWNFSQFSNKPSKFSSREPKPAWHIGNSLRFCGVSTLLTRECSKWTSGSSSTCPSRSFASLQLQFLLLPSPSLLRFYPWSASIVHQQRWSLPHLWSHDLCWAERRRIESSLQFPRRKRWRLQLDPWVGGWR